MKTVFIDCSPKMRLSASGFIMRLTGLFVFGKKKKEKLRTPADHDRVLSEMELSCLERNKDLNVYVIANNGFIEGKQNEPLMQIMENFCDRSGIKWCGGLGIGGGVMMNVMRIMLIVFLGIALMRTLLSGINEGIFFPACSRRKF